MTFSSCTITGNTAGYVRAHPQNFLGMRAYVQKFPSPRWEFLLTCPIDSHLSIRIVIWFYQGYVRASHACKLPIAPMGFSHVSRFVLAGWRCAHLQRHGDLLIVHHHGQHSWLCACSRSKVPIAPMGKLLTRLPRLPLAQLRPTHRSTTVCTCRRDLQCFPSTRWDYHMICACACRAAVSMSTASR